MKRSLFVILVAAVSAILAAAVSPLPEQCVFSSRARFAPNAPVVEPAVTIPFKLVTRHIVVPVTINNSRPLSFVFDTGDKVGIVDIERAKQLGLDLHGGGVALAAPAPIRFLVRMCAARTGNCRASKSFHSPSRWRLPAACNTRCACSGASELMS